MGSSELDDALAGHQRVAVDTAPLVYFLADASPRAAVTEQLLQRAAQGAVQLTASTITEAELLVGPLRAGHAAAVHTIQLLLDGPADFELVAVTREIAQRAARLRAELGLGLADATVAATALVADCTALVTNDKALDRLAGRLAVLQIDRISPAG